MDSVCQPYPASRPLRQKTPREIGIDLARSVKVKLIKAPYASICARAVTSNLVSELQSLRTQRAYVPFSDQRAYAPGRCGVCKYVYVCFVLPRLFARRDSNANGRVYTLLVKKGRWRRCSDDLLGRQLVAAAAVRVRVCACLCEAARVTARLID